MQVYFIVYYCVHKHFTFYIFGCILTNMKHQVRSTPPTRLTELDRFAAQLTSAGIGNQQSGQGARLFDLLAVDDDKTTHVVKPLGGMAIYDWKTATYGLSALITDENITDRYPTRAGAVLVHVLTSIASSREVALGIDQAGRFVASKNLPASGDEASMVADQVIAFGTAVNHTIETVIPPRDPAVVSPIELSA